MNCAQLSEFDEALSAKEAEIEAMKERALQLETVMDPTAVPLMVSPSPAMGDHSRVAV